MEVLVLILITAAVVCIGGSGLGERDKRQIVIALGLGIALLLFVQSANAAWRSAFPLISGLTELNINDAVSIECYADEGHADYRLTAWPRDSHYWEAQVLAETSPGVYKLGRFKDLWFGKNSFEEFWEYIGGDLQLSTELPYWSSFDFVSGWPNIPPDEEELGYITLTLADGVWSIDSLSTIYRFGLCGMNEFDALVGQHLEVTLNPAANRFEGTMTNQWIPNQCVNRSWQPYYCEVGKVRCQNYCAYLAEHHGRWEEKLNRWRVYIENFGYSPQATEVFFQWQVNALEIHTITNACPGAGDETAAPRILFAQCEILQEMIDDNRVSPSRVARLSTQYERLGCPCSADSDSNGFPDYFDYADPMTECPDWAMVPETLAHEAYVIPVPEPSQMLLLGVGVSALIGLRRWKRIR
jgi:hypothetical protein